MDTLWITGCSINVNMTMDLKHERSPILYEDSPEEYSVQQGLCGRPELLELERTSCFRSTNALDV